jgi:hypothetical protein
VQSSKEGDNKICFSRQAVFQLLGNEIGAERSHILKKTGSDASLFQTLAIYVRLHNASICLILPSYFCNLSRLVAISLQNNQSTAGAFACFTV